MKPERVLEVAVMNTFRRVIFIVMAGLLASPVLAAAGESDAGKCQSLYTAGNYEQALAPCTKAAGQGEGEAQFNLGRMYHNGEGVAQDYKQAHKWYSSADDQGYADADSKSFLKDMYYHGAERTSIIYVLEDPGPGPDRSKTNYLFNSPKRNCVMTAMRDCLMTNREPSACMTGVASGSFGLIPRRFDVSYNRPVFVQGFNAGWTCNTLND